MALKHIEWSALETMSPEEMEGHLDGVTDELRPLILTKDGTPTHAIVSYEWWRKVVPERHPRRDEVGPEDEV